MSKPHNFVLPPPNEPILGNDNHAQFALPPLFWTPEPPLPHELPMQNPSYPVVNEARSNNRHQFPIRISKPALFATQSKCVVRSFQAACKISCHAGVPPMLGWYEVRPGQLARPDGSPVLGRKQLYTKRKTITTCP